MATVESSLTVVRLLDGLPDANWNRYVFAHAQSSVFHRSEWAAVYAELPWIDLCYLEATRGGTLVGVMPLARVRFGLKGSALVSAPYCVQAGALADDGATQRALENAALAQAQTCGVDFVELRQTLPAHPEWPMSQRFCSFARPLASTVQENLQAVPRKQRAMIRKGEAAGLVVSRGLGVDAFYRLYATSVRNLGTPVYSRRLFAALARHFADSFELLKVEHAGKLIAAVWSFYHQHTVLPYYAGALPVARSLKAYDYLYWQLMCSALTRGCTRFDFGRSLCASGAAAFKRNWGFDGEPLHYQVRPVGRASVHELDPDSPFNRVARQAWSRLPLVVANALGPRLAQRLY